REPEGVHLLSAKATSRRLQQCRPADRADGERGRGQRPRPCRPARSAGRPGGSTPRLRGRRWSSRGNPAGSLDIQAGRAIGRGDFPAPRTFEMTRFSAFLLAAPLAVAAPAPALAQTGLAQVQAHLQAVQTMTASFTQTDARGRALSGTLTIKRPG